MARLNLTRASTDRSSTALSGRAKTEDSLYRDRTPTTSRAPADSILSPSPALSQSSDKENRPDANQRVGDSSRGKKIMAPPSAPTTNNSEPRSAKRRKLGERNLVIISDQNGEEQSEDLKWYDPNQDLDERRKVRVGMRDVARQLHDRQDEFLAGDNSGLLDLIDQQNSYMDRVKQTSDATIDARFLVQAADLSHKKATRLAFGDSSAIGLDLDEFVSKCISFMKNGRPLGQNEEEPVSTQARRNRRQAATSDSEDEGNDDGDALPWHVLGELACFPHNRRPPVPSFLLGPLSIQKRTRVTQRRARQRRESVGAQTKPQTIQKEDLQRGETNNLTNQCAEIKKLLQQITSDGQKAIEEEAHEEMDEEQARELFNRNNLAMNYEVSLFKFAVNPKSFGQTVENLFYISFLIKDGFIALSKDEDGLMTIRPREPTTEKQQHAQGAARHQSILSLDHMTWQKFVRAFAIRRPLIPHRQDDQNTQVNSRGWYG